MPLTTTQEAQDWPKEEAALEARHFLELVADGEEITYIQNVINDHVAHWLDVFGDETDDLRAFSDEFNRLMSHTVLRITVFDDQLAPR